MMFGALAVEPEQFCGAAGNLGRAVLFAAKTYSSRSLMPALA
jgi:hypothetical protein